MRLKSLFLFLIASIITGLAFPTDTLAQVIQIGTGTATPSSTLYSPIYRFSATSATTHARSNIVYTSAELTAAGITAGSNITAIAFNKTNVGQFSVPINYNIYMANSTVTPPLSTSTTWTSILASHTLVYSSTAFNVPNAAGWMTINLATPFVYTGGSIEIAFDHDMTGGGSGATSNIAFEYTDGLATSAIGATSTGTPPVTLNGTVSTYKHRPNIRFTLAPSTPNNISPSSLVSPVDFCAGLNNITIKVSNYGTNDVDSFRVNWSLDGVDQPQVLVSTPITAAGGSTNVLLGSHTFTPTGVTLKAWTSHPNGLADSYTDNDTIEVILQPSLSGTYTINSGATTGGTNFNSIGDFTDALEARGVCGPVVANIVAGSGPYNEFVEIKEYSGVSATNTVRINGNGETVQFNNTSTDRHLLILNGAKYVTIDNIEFKALNTTYGFGANLYSGAMYDSIINCTFDLTAVTTTSSVNSNGITLSNSLTSATTSGANVKHCYIGGNTILGTTNSGGQYYGITVTTGSDSNTFENNEISNFYYYGLYINGGLRNKYIGNEIHRKTKTSSTTFYGLYTTGTISGNVISKNKIHSPQANGLATTGSNYMIYMFGDGVDGNPVIISNNTIYNVNRGGIIYGIYGSTVLHNLIYHNTVEINQAVGSTSATYAIYLAGTNTGTKFRNNLVSLTGGTDGTKYGAYYASTSSIDTLMKNIIYVNTTGISGTTYYGYLGTTHASLDDFRASYPMHEVGTMDADPMFMDPSTGNLQPLNTAIAENGVDLTTYVSDDILGETRSTTPTPGAYEIEALANDISAFAILSPVDYCAGLETVEVNVINMGTNTVNNYRVNWSINGVVQPFVSVTTPLTPAGSPASSNNVVLGTYTFTTAPAEIKIWTSHPNGGVDGNTTNDTVTETKTPAMSGTYTINSGAAASATNFVSIKAFTDSLQSKGICGPVVANIVAGSGPYNEFVTFTNISGASETNTITLNGNGETVQYSNDVTNRQLLVLNGARFVTVKNIEFKALNSTYGWGAVITNNSYRDSIIDCTFDLSLVTTTSSTNSSGICFTSSVTSPTSTGSPAGVACYVGGNTILGTSASNGYYYGIVIAGTNTDSNIIENNEVADFYYYGVYQNGGAANKIIGNEIHRAGKTNSVIFYGIYTTGTTPGGEVSKNRVHSQQIDGGTGSNTTYGMMLYGDGTASDPVIVANNIVYNMNRAGSSYGIYLSATLYAKIMHNTIVFDKNLTGSIWQYGIASYGTNTGTLIYNNNVYLNNTSPGTKYGMYYGAITAFDDVQRNNVFVAGASSTNYYAYLTTTYATLDAFRTANPSLEVGSVSVNPNFVSAATGNFEPLNPALAFLGMNVLTYVPDDINGNVRIVSPTVGAYQKPPLMNNTGVESIVTPVNFCVGIHDITVKVRNYSSNTVNNVTLNWTLNGVAQPSIAITTPLGPITGSTPPNFIDVVLTSHTFTTDPVEIVAWTSNPNSVADTYPDNDTLHATLKASMSGYYTVNQAAPTAGTNFNSISDLTDYLNEYGVCGPVTVEVVEGSGPYVDVMKFGNIPGASATNTIRIFGHRDTIQYENTSTERQMLVFNKTSYVTVENLVFKTLASEYGWGASIMNESHHDSIKNCYFDLTMTSTTSSVNSAGITFSAATTSPTSAGSNGHDFYIGGTTIQGPESGGMYYGITVYGNSTSYNENIVLENNKVLDFGYYGIYLYSVRNITVRNNEIARPNKSTSNAFYGLYTSDNLAGSLFEGNRIHTGVKTTGGTNLFYGIYLFGDGTATEPVKFINNAVYNPNHGGTVYLLYGSAVLYNEFYHNSFVLNSELSGTSTNYGVYFTGTNTGSEFKNNLISITGGTEGTKYGIYYGSGASSMMDPQRNMIYVNSPTGTNYYAYRSANYATLAAFQTAFPTLELGSISVDPIIADPVSGAIMPTNLTVEGTGLDLTAIVPTDILGDTRPVPPTPGCWEIDLSQLNDAGTVEILYPVEDFCEGEHEVKVLIKNYGLNGLYSVNVNYNVGGTTGTIVHDEYIPGYLSEPNNIDTVSLGVHYFTNGVDMPILVYTSSPNGATDINMSNDTLRDTLTAAYRMPVDIGNDTAICNTHTITLDAGIPGAEYLWSTGATTKTIDVNAEGIYHVRVKTPDGCVGYDTMELDHIEIVVGLPEVDTLCFGETLTLDAGNPGSSYFWSTGESTQQIEVNSDGMYTVVVTSPQGCVEYDTIQVVVFGYAPTMAGIAVNNLGPLSYRFEAILPENIIRYAWDFGDGTTSAATTPSKTYDEPGTYLVTCTVDSDCGQKVYTTYVTIFNSADDVDLNSNDINVYPNPATNIVTVELTGSATLQQISVVNTLGQVIKTLQVNPGLNKTTIDVSSLPSGSYYLKVTSDKGAVNKPFQILK